MSSIFKKRGLIVSCQALPDEPLYGGDTMMKMAVAAEEAGAIGIRTNGTEDISRIKGKVNLPLIGIIKKTMPDTSVFITPTMKEVKEVIEAGADIVAVDTTDRGDRLKEVKEMIDYIHHKNAYAMADISVIEEGIKAEELGADFISTTLSGYTSYSPQQDQPDFKLIRELSEKVKKVPVVAEGRIKTPEEAVKAMKFGAKYVVVGSAITRPQLIAADYVNMVSDFLETQDNTQVKAK